MILRAFSSVLSFLIPDTGAAMSPLTPDYARPPSETPPQTLDTSDRDLAWYQDETVRLTKLVAELEAENRKLRAAVDWHARADGMA